MRGVSGIRSAQDGPSASLGVDTAQRRTFDINNFPFADADGAPMILEMDLDITEQRRAEAALKELNENLERRVAERTEALAESERRLRTIGDQIPGGAIYQHVRRPDGQVSYAYMSAGVERSSASRRARHVRS